MAIQNDGSAIIDSQPRPVAFDHNKNEPEEGQSVTSGSGWQVVCKHILLDESKLNVIIIL